MQERPSQILTELRQSTGRSKRDFAELTGYTYSTQHRLENDLTPFRRPHLDALVAAGWCKEGDTWCARFEQAIAATSAARNGDDQDPVEPADAEPFPDWSATEPGQPAALGTRSDRARLHPAAGQLSLDVSTASWISRVALPAGSEPADEVLQQSEEIQQVAGVARLALDELTSLYAHAGAKIAAIMAASDMLQHSRSTDMWTPSDEAAAILARAVLQGIDEAVERSTSKICQLVEEGAGGAKPRPARGRWLRRFSRG
jgi:hypothetical protein